MQTWPLGDSASARRIREHDWAATPLGPCDTWPPRLRTMVDLMLAAAHPALVAWGPALVLLYNDAFAAVLGTRDAAAFGQPGRTLCGAKWPALQPVVRATLDGEPQLWADLRLTDGAEADRWFTVSCTPLRDAAGEVAGVYGVCIETTAKVRAHHALRGSRDRQALLLRLSDTLRALTDPVAIQLGTARLLGRYLTPDRAGYAELTDDGEQLHVLEECLAPDLHTLSGFHPRERVDAAWIERLEQGQSLRLERLRDPALSAPPEEETNCPERWDAGAWLVVPVRREGASRGALYLYQRAARRWSEAEVRLLERAAVRVGTALQWAEAIQALRAGERRRRFLLTLSDTLRGLDDPAAIARAGCHLLGEHLLVDRVAFLTDGGAQEGLQTWRRGGEEYDGPEPAGNAAVGMARPEQVMHQLLGDTESLACADTRFLSAPDPALQQFLADAGVAAFCAFAFRDDARHPAALLASSQSPRAWTDEEIELAREVGSRLWLASARASAVAELAVRETELAQVQMAGGVGGVIVDLSGGLSGGRSPEYRNLHGLAPEITHETHEQWLARVHPQDRDAAEARLRAAIESGEDYASDYRIVRPDNGEIRWISARAKIQRDEHGRPLRLIGIHMDSTERHTIEEALRLSEQRLHTLVTGVPQLVWRGVGAGQWTWASPQWTEYTGQSLEQSRGWGWLEPVHPDDRETARAEWAAAAGDGSFSAEYRLLNHAEHRYRWFRTRATPVRNSDGSISEWLGTSTDVDDLRRLQQRQQVLVDELQHRTRNLMGVISALSRRTVASSDSLDTYAASFDDRLAALSRANNLLSRLGEGERISFDTLIRTELDALGAFEHSVGTVELDGSADIYLRSRTVQIFALALHELGTNAVKYGALARSGARLSLRWRREERPGQAPQLLLEWRESGFAVPAPQRAGYGRELIERALPYQLGAQTRLEYGVDGVTCVIRVPIWARDKP